MTNERPLPGVFVTFEGGEGAGKSTQINRLAERLRRLGMKVTVTREPGGTSRAEAIRQLILSGGAQHLGVEGEAVLFAAARADHVDKVIRPALERGEWVLCDRFTDSTRVYQGAVGGADDTLLKALERVSTGLVKPDLTLILDVPVRVGQLRLAKRQAGTGTEGRGEEPDRFEREARASHEHRRQAFLKIARAEPQRCVVIDGSESEAAVADEIWRTVTARLLQKAA